MKFRFLFLLPFLCLCSCGDGVKQYDPNTHYDNVYIIMGQSNATGISKASFLETKSPVTYQKFSTGVNNVLISYDVDQRVEENYVPVKFGQGANNEHFGPEIGIADILSEANETSYIVKATWSGSCLQADYMNKDGDRYRLYDRFVPFIKHQIKKLKDNGKNPRLKGLFWMQGESDSWNVVCDTYGQAFDVFMKSLRKEFNDYIYTYFNFVDAYISTRSPHWPNPTVINTQKQVYSEKDEHNYCIKTNGEDESALNLVLKSESLEDPNDSAHYDSLSMLALGKEAGKYLIK